MTSCCLETERGQLCHWLSLSWRLSSSSLPLGEVPGDFDSAGLLEAAGNERSLNFIAMENSIMGHRFKYQ